VKRIDMNKEIAKAGTFMKLNLEAFIWIAVLVYFAVSPVLATDHFTLCPLSNAGFEYCPGCGLGRSIVLLIHGHVSESLNMHPLAIFAVILFSTRIVGVFRNYFRFQKQVSTLNNTEYQ
jgi:hypothetical protein